MDRPAFQTRAFRTRALRDPRLAAHAITARGAWLFARDGSELLWTNVAGAALLSISAPVAAFTLPDEMREDIARLAARLPLDGTARLERLFGFGAPFGQRSTCSCARLSFSDGTVAVLVVEASAQGRALPYATRLAWLIDGTPEPLALFDADGVLVAATDAARAVTGTTTDLATLGLPNAREAVAEDGRSDEITAQARFRLFRLGHGAETAIAAFMSPIAPAAHAPQIVEPPHSPIDASPATSEALSRDIVKVRESVSNEPSSPQGGAGRGQKRPLRFVWLTDAAGRFRVDSDDFTARMDAAVVAMLGRPWSEIAATFAIDHDARVAQALATGQTWNGVATDWPLDRTRRIRIELSGAPVFDADKQFAGYRGFGLCRDPDAITESNAPAELPASEPAAHAHEVAPISIVASTPPSAPGNVLRFPAPMEPKGELRVPSLSPVENSAFDEIARQLAARLQATPASEAPASEATPDVVVLDDTNTASAGLDRTLIDNLPLGIVIYRTQELLHANRAFLDHAGYADLQSLIDVGGLDVLAVAADADGNLTLITPRQDQPPAPVRKFTLSWDDEDAHALIVLPHQAQTEPAPPPVQDDVAARERNDLLAVVEATGESIVMLDADARIINANRSTENLFAIAGSELRGQAFVDLFDAGSRHAVLEALQGALQSTPPRSRDVAIRRDGAPVPLSLTLARLPGGGLFARIIDQSGAKETEDELAAARRRAETAATAKSDAIGRISHDIRTPLNAIIGFADVMIGEQFGPVGNPRYLEYLRDIRASGERVAGLIDDMGNLSRAETGKIDLSFTSVALNEIVEQCAATLQPQANRERIIIRTSLSRGLPHVTADARTLRQVVLNLIATSIRLNHAGGQVIVSTALTDNGDVALRVRDTGAGLSAQDVSAATEPHRMSAAPENGGASGAGISLALTRALVEANRARFDIRSAPNTGTLIEVIFTAPRQAMAR